ncbi:hypothetical protein FOZ63_000616, partial [Perkinsus olseni]
MCPSTFKDLCVMIDQKVHIMKVSPFGLSIAPKVATSLITWLLRDIPYPISSFIDDIIIEDQKGKVDAETKADPESVRLVRTALAEGNMYCKETCAIDDSTRVLGLDLYKKDGRLWWRRRDDLHLNLEFSEPVTRRELAAWCGRLVGHVPIARWLRPHAAVLLYLSSRGGWDEEVDDIVEDSRVFILSFIS